jgi:redox-sensing transcriptional repressor
VNDQLQNAIPVRTVERLVLYRRLLDGLVGQKIESVHSQKIADMAYNSAAQVRRDLMVVGCMGSPAHGYSVQELITRIDGLFERTGPQKVALVGLGKLGRAILAFLGLRQSRLRVTVAFDSDEAKTNRVVDGCTCHPVKDMPEIIAREGITVGIVAVPAQAAQQAVDLMVIAGVRGFLNFAPTLLKVPKYAFVDNVDITMKLEKVAFFAEPAAEKSTC